MDWRVATLNSLGAPVTKQNLAALAAWQKMEGGHTNNDATYNWLNTTRNAPGAVKSINSVGVKKFSDFNSGVAATVATLGSYPSIVNLLRSGRGDMIVKDRNAQGDLAMWLSGKREMNNHTTGYVRKIAGLMGYGYNVPVDQGPTPDVMQASLDTSPEMAPLERPDFSRQRLIANLMNQARGSESLTSMVLNALESRANMAAMQQQKTNQPARRELAKQSKVGSAPATFSGKGGVRELFYDPLGAYDEGKWISPIGGHSDHVHVSFGSPEAAMQIIRYAQNLGLRASENPWAEGSAAEAGVHTPTSYHYRNFPGEYKGGRSSTLGRALDVSGNSDQMAAFYRWVKQQYIGR